MDVVPKAPHHGWIEVIAGSMFSGKSEELIRRLRRAQIARQKVQIFKPLIDNRYSEDHIVSHSDMRIASQNVRNSDDLVREVADDTEVVGIDVVRRVEAPRLHVLAVLVVEVVVDGEQQPARSYRVEQRPDGRLAGSLGQRRVLHRHEVERAGRERNLQGVSADPLDRGAVQLSSLPGPSSPCGP